MDKTLNITEDFASLFAEYVKNEKQEGQIAKGRVVAVERDAVIVDVGLKSEGRIPLSEFSLAGNNANVSIGDEIEVFVERFEGRGGNTILSREKAIRSDAWKKFEEFHKQDATIEGVIIGRVKGGFAVELGGIVAFLPGSQVDIRPIKDSSVLINMSQPLKILKMDAEHGNVVVSRRAILEESRKEAREELLSNIKEGMILEGVIKNITDYGAFVDLKSTDGLLHITDISWNKISHPSEVLTIGQIVKTIVIKYNPETQRISLGLKQLEKNPWEDLKDQYQTGIKFKGIVTSITDYGAFVALEPGVEGLVYHTEINWTAKNTHPSKRVKIGEEVEVMVLDIDIQKHRISLSMKQCLKNPWDIFAEEFPVGTKMQCMIKTMSDYCLFVVKEGDIEDESAMVIIIPISELSWTKNGEEVIKEYNRGDVLECILTNIDSERERITASIRQLTPDIVTELAAEWMKLDHVNATIIEIQNDCIVVELENGIRSFVDKTELAKHRDEQKPSKFICGTKIEVKVISFDKSTRRLQSSIKALEEAKNAKAFAAFSGANDGNASLGDLLGSVLNQKKNDE